MRLVAMALAVIAAVPVFAQDAPARRPNIGELLNETQVFDAYIRAHVAAMRRDAGIMMRVAKAARSLEEFQKTATMSVAQDSIRDALKLAQDSPRASAPVVSALEEMDEMIEAAKRQGVMANIPELRTEILVRGERIQVLVMRELDEARAARETLGQLQTRMLQMSGHLDHGLTDAIGSTLYFVRAGSCD